MIIRLADGKWYPTDLALRPEPQQSVDLGMGIAGFGALLDLPRLGGQVLHAIAQQSTQKDHTSSLSQLIAGMLFRFWVTLERSNKAFGRKVSSLHGRIPLGPLYSDLVTLVAQESQHLDRSALQAVVAAAWEEFDAEILLLVRDGSKIRLGASESGGLNARMILAQCLSRLNQLEEQTLDTTTRAFVRVVSEDLKNDQVVLLIVRGQGDIRLACGAGAHGKVRDMLDDALQSIGGERRRR